MWCRAVAVLALGAMGVLGCDEQAELSGTEPVPATASGHGDREVPGIPAPEGDQVAPGNPGGQRPQGQAGGLPIDLGEYRFGAGFLAENVRQIIADTVAQGCAAQGLSPTCVSVVVETDPTGAEQGCLADMPPGTLLFSRMDRPFFSGAEKRSGATAAVGETVVVYAVPCRVSTEPSTESTHPTAAQPPTTIDTPTEEAGPGAPSDDGGETTGPTRTDGPGDG